MAEDGSRSASMAQVHAAWLAAGADGDVSAMARLRREHPAWLDLQRPVGPALVGADGTESTVFAPSRFCGWEDFHLPTIGASALHTAAWEGKLPVIELLLEAGQSPDSADDGAMTPIMVAILRYNLVVTRCIFHHGHAVRRNVVVDCRETEGRLEKTTLDTIELLLRFGADVNATSQELKSALHCAADGDGLQVAKRLLDAGAAIDGQDKKGHSPLYCCVKEDSLLVANLLLSRAAQIDLADSEGTTPLTFALRKQNLSMLQLFLNHHHMVSTARRQDFGAAVLLEAVELASETVVRLLVEDEYAPITTSNATGETLLHRAIALQKPTLVELLLRLDPAGENIRASTREGESPAHYAAQYGNRAEMEVLLVGFRRVLGDLDVLGEANPLNAVDRRGATSLYLAGTLQVTNASRADAIGTQGGREGRSAKVQLLLQHGARLLPGQLLLTWLTPRTSDVVPASSRLLLPVQIQSCLELWLAGGPGLRGEARDAIPPEVPGAQIHGRLDPDALLTDLCLKWLTVVASTGDVEAILPVVASAGYARETLPLLAGLPLRRVALPELLGHVERFAVHSVARVLLLQLHSELTEAWETVLASTPGA